MSKPKRRRHRIVLATIAGGALLLILFIILLPTFVNWGLGQGYIRNAIKNRIQGDVALGKVNFSWLGQQQIHGLTVTDPAGKQAAKLNIQVNSSLLDLVLGRTDTYDVTVTGTLNAQMREDGSISFVDLLATDQSRAPGAPQPPSAPAPSPPQPSEPFRLPELPGLTLRLENLTLNLENLATGQTLVLNDLNGRLAYVDPAQPITLDLEGQTLSDQTPGSLKLNAVADGLFDANGVLELRQATARLNLDAQSIPLPLPGIDAPTHLRNLALQAASDDMTERIIVEMTADAQVAGHDPTQVRLNATLGSVLSGRGELSLRGASAHAALSVQDAPILATNLQGLVQSAAIAIASDDLTQAINLTIQGDAQIQGHEPSTLSGDLQFNELLAPDGTVQFALDKITGQVHGQRVPTPILQPLLEATPIVATRDIGPLLDIDASFSAGTQRDVTVAVAGERLRLEALGNVNPVTGEVVGSRLVLEASALHPALVAGYVPAAQLDQPVGVNVQLTSFKLVIDPQTNQLNLPQIAAAGTLNVAGPATLRFVPVENAAQGEHEGEGSSTAAGATPLSPTADEQVIAIALQSLTANIDTPALADHLDLSGSLGAERAVISFDHRITGLFNAEGELDLVNVRPIGTLSANGVQAATLSRVAGGALTPQQQQAMEAAVGPALNATVETRLEGDELHATVQAAAALFTAELIAIRHPAALEIFSGHTTLTVTPELASLLQSASESPIALHEPAVINVDLQSFSMPQVGAFQYEIPRTEPIRATFDVSDIVASNVPSLVEPLGIRGLMGEVQAMVEGSAMAYSALGDVEIRRPNTDRTIARTRYRVKFTDRAETAHDELSAAAGMAEVSMPNLERMLGQQRGAISQWTGNTGSLQVELTSKAGIHHGEMTVTYPRLEMHLHGDADETMVSFSGEAPKVLLDRQVLEQRLNPAPASQSKGSDQAGDQAATRGTRVEADVPLSIVINNARIPRAMTQGQPFDPTAAQLDVSVTSGPINLIDSSGIRTSLSDLIMAINTSDLAEGVGFNLSATAGITAPNQPGLQQQQSAEPGELQVTGKLAGLVAEDATFSLANPVLQMNANATRIPTAVADLLANMQGLLVAAVGPQMNATFMANDFSPSSGTLDVRIETANGRLNALIRGRENSFRLNKDNPLTAELALTPELRDRLLNKIHPILADVRTTEQPVRSVMNWAVVPLDEQAGGIDVSGLQANLEITIGKVALDSGSALLGALRLFNQERATIPGEIEPIVATIRDGVVRYQKFAVRIDKYTLNYSGQIDLVNQTAALRTEIPLEALAHTFSELEGYADKIVVPLVTHGPLANLRTEIDPQFDIGQAALQAGFRGGLDELLRGQGKGSLEDLLKDAIKPKPKPRR